MLNVVRIVAVILAAVFAVQNLSSTSISLFAWDADMPVFAVVLFFSALGFALGYFARRPKRSKRTK